VFRCCSVFFFTHIFNVFYFILFFIFNLVYSFLEWELGGWGWGDKSFDYFESFVFPHLIWFSLFGNSPFPTTNAICNETELWFCWNVCLGFPIFLQEEGGNEPSKVKRNVKISDKLLTIWTRHFTVLTPDCLLGIVFCILTSQGIFEPLGSSCLFPWYLVGWSSPSFHILYILYFCILELEIVEWDWDGGDAESFMASSYQEERDDKNEELRKMKKLLLFSSKLPPTLLC